LRGGSWFFSIQAVPTGRPMDGPDGVERAFLLFSVMSALVMALGIVALEVL
jgi:hypothetical protein